MLYRVLALLAILFWLPQGIWAKEVPPRLVEPAEVTQLLAQPDSGIIVMDVRTPEEYAKGHLRNAINVNFFGPGFEDEIAKLPAEKPILVYCRTGVRSARAADMIRESGHDKVMDLAGGITAWEKSGLPVESGAP